MITKGIMVRCRLCGAHVLVRNPENSSSVLKANDEHKKVCPNQRWSDES